MFHRRHPNRKHKKSGILFIILLLLLMTVIGKEGIGEMEQQAVTSSESGSLSHFSEDGILESDSLTVENSQSDSLIIETESDAENQSDTSEGSSFRIYFIDVGQGDAALIQCDGESMVIDGGNSEHSRTMYAFLKAKKVTELKYMIATHPDADHIGGLAGALNYAKVDEAFCSVKNHDTATFQTLKKYLQKQNISLEIPEQGQTLKLGSAKITILSSHYAEDDSNNNSIVCRIVYGKTSFLFTGDAETEEENSIMDSGLNLKSMVLKVAHHGSNSSTSEAFLKAVAPEYAVISVGADNDYGHPTKKTLTRLKSAGAEVYRTDLQGTILCESNGKKVTFTPEQDQNVDTYSTDSANNDGTVSRNSGGSAEDSDADYILNTSSMKFHLPGCSAVDSMSERNKKSYTGTREELIDKGYSPCGICNP